MIARYLFRLITSAATAALFVFIALLLVKTNAGAFLPVAEALRKVVGGG